MAWVACPLDRPCGIEELVLRLDPELIHDEYVHDAAQADTLWTRTIW